MLHGRWTLKLAAIIVVITLLPTNSLAYGGFGSGLGDVDGNGVVDANDAKLISVYLAGNATALSHPENADVTQDGRITIEDALAIAQMALGRSFVLVARNEHGLPGKAYPGRPMIIEVFEHFGPFNITAGYVNIRSESTGYDSGYKPMSFRADGLSLYYRWNTTGLPAAKDYEIRVNFTGAGYNSTAPEMVVALGPRFFEEKKLAEEIDTYTPAPGVPLEFIRTFPQDSGSAPYLGPLGRGWVHTLDMHLEEFTDGYVAFMGSDGFNRWFASNGDGSYTSSPGDYGKLTRDASGKFQLREKDGFIFGFRADLKFDHMADPNGNNITAVYAGGRLVGAKHSNGLNMSFEYNAQGRISKVTDTAGKETLYSYDDSGEHLMSVTANGNRTTSYTYSIGASEASDHRLTSVTYPDGTHIYYTYDSEGRLASMERDGGAGRLEYNYDANGTTRVRDALGGETRILVNEIGQTKDITGPSGLTMRYEYDGSFNPVKMTDSDGRNYTFAYDERGNIIMATDPSANRTSVGYDPVYNKVAWLNDSMGRMTTFSYNANGNLIEISYPDGSKDKLAYDADNRLKSSTGRGGQTINYTFNGLGLMTSKAYPDGASESYDYDETGRIVNAADSSGTMKFEYDAAGNLARMTYPGSRSFQYEYNAAGKLTKVTDPDGNIQAYGYDSSGRLAKISNGTGFVFAEYQYDNADRITRKLLGDGAYTAYDYYPDGRVRDTANYGPSGGMISFFNYTYDAAGRLVSRQGTEGFENYTYDNLGQLVAVRHADGSTEGFAYDAMGNRVAATTNGTRMDYTTNQLNQYTSAGAATYTYDPNGNMASVTENGRTTYYDYDYENRLVRVRNQTSEITYTYNPFGLRSSRSDSSGLVRYLWDSNQVAIEEDGSHNTIASYVWGGPDEAISMERGGNRYYYAQDAMRSVSDLLDSSGSRVEHYSYSAFGRPLSPSSLGNPWFFTGLSYDFGSGLQYNRFRWYSPGIGRFITPDPININGGLNIYAYGFNSPTMFSDPDGTFAVWIQIVAWVLIVTYTLNAAVGYPRGAIPPSALRGGATATDFMYRVNQLNRAAAGGGGRGGTCPTFIQIPSNAGGEAEPTERISMVAGKLGARITVPVEGALLRSDIPIFGAVGGDRFQEYRVEYGEGRSPSEWHLITSSTTPQPETDVGIAEMQQMQGDIDLRGNLATWNTGLKNWVHLPWHPPEETINLKGIYTLRLTAFGKDGQFAEDSMAVEVGDVIAQCLPCNVTSPDGKAAMRFPEHSLTEPFRVYSIVPVSDAGESVPPLPSGIRTIGKAYRIREPGDRFIKEVALEFSADNKELSGLDVGRIGIMRYDGKVWSWIATYRSGDNSTFAASITELPAPRAVFALGYEEGNIRSQVKAEKPQNEYVAASNDVLVYNDFENSTGQWANRDSFMGATVERVRNGADGSYALKVTNIDSGGSFGVTAFNQPFDAREYPIMSFDYQIGPGIRTDFYLLAGGRWYDLGFTDGKAEFKNRDVNIANLGSIGGIAADGGWHSASVNIYELLRQKTGNTRVDAIMMADWSAGGYMKLDFGRNAQGAAYYIDNFRISSGRRYENAVTMNLSEANGAGGIFYGTDTVLCSATTGGGSLNLSYDLPRTGTYCGYWANMSGIDIGEMKEVTLLINSSSALSVIYLGMRQRPWVEPKVSIIPYLVSEGGGWQKFSVPLTAFHGLSNLSPMDAISLTVEEPNMGGDLLVSNITFSDSQSFGRVVDFNAHGMESNLLGGGFSSSEQQAATISSGYHIDYSTDPPTGAVRISYGGNIGLDYGNGKFSYSMWEAGLAGFDASGFGDLVLKIKGENGGEKPDIWLSDGATRRAVRAKEFAPLTDSWQEIRIPLEKFSEQGLDVSHLESVQVVFEWEKMSGTVYISGIRFEGKPYHAEKLSLAGAAAAQPQNAGFYAAVVPLVLVIALAGVAAFYARRRWLG